MNKWDELKSWVKEQKKEKEKDPYCWICLGGVLIQMEKYDNDECNVSLTEAGY